MKLIFINFLKMKNIQLNHSYMNKNILGKVKCQFLLIMGNDLLNIRHGDNRTNEWRSSVRQCADKRKLIILILFNLLFTSTKKSETTM